MLQTSFNYAFAQVEGSERAMLKMSRISSIIILIMYLIYIGYELRARKTGSSSSSSSSISNSTHAHDVESQPQALSTTAVMTVAAQSPVHSRCNSAFPVSSSPRAALQPRTIRFADERSSSTADVERSASDVGGLLDKEGRRRESSDEAVGFAFARLKLAAGCDDDDDDDGAAGGADDDVEPPPESPRGRRSADAFGPVPHAWQRWSAAVAGRSVRGHSRSLSLASLARSLSLSRTPSAARGAEGGGTAFRMLRDGGARSFSADREPPIVSTREATETTTTTTPPHRRSKSDRLVPIVILVVASALMSMAAEFLVSAVDDLTHASASSPPPPSSTSPLDDGSSSPAPPSTTGPSLLSESVIGLIILPLFGNVAELATVASLAVRGRARLAVAVAAGSAVQTALCVGPVAVLAAWAMGRELRLGTDDAFDAAALVGAAALAGLLALGVVAGGGGGNVDVPGSTRAVGAGGGAGRGAGLKGALLIACYGVVG